MITAEDSPASRRVKRALRVAKLSMQQAKKINFDEECYLHGPLIRWLQSHSDRCKFIRVSKQRLLAKKIVYFDFVVNSIDLKITVSNKK